MGKILKKGKVIILLSGKHAGKKAIIVKTFDDGTQARRFSHALVAGIDRHPRRVSKAMSQKKLKKKSKIKPFVKCVNFTHMMPTRYTVDLDLQRIVTPEKLEEDRRDVAKTVKTLFEGRYMNQDEARS